MAGGNRFKHRSLSGGLYPDRQQEPSSRFYTPEEKKPLDLLAVLQSLGDASSEWSGKANADPVNRLSPFGPVPTQFGRDLAGHLWDSKFGLVPAGKAIDATSTLIDVLSGKEKSIPFAPAKSGELGGDAINNAGLAALDASTLVPGFGIVPKMGKAAWGAGKEIGASRAFTKQWIPEAAANQGRAPLGERLGRLVGNLPENIKTRPLTYADRFTVDDVRIPYRYAIDNGWSKKDALDYAAAQAGLSLDEAADALEMGRRFDKIDAPKIAQEKQTIDDTIAAIQQHKDNKAIVEEARKNMPPEDFAAIERRIDQQLAESKLPKDQQLRAQFERMSLDERRYMFAKLKQEGADATHLLGDLLEAPKTQNPFVAIPGGKPPSDPTTLGMGFPFSGKDGEKPLLSALMDAFKGKPKESPLDQFTPPKSLDDIFTGGSPRGPRELTGGSQNPAGMDGSAFNLNTPEVPYDPAKGFQGLDARFASDKNAKTLSEALAKARDPKGPTTLGMGAPFEGKGKPAGYNDWAPEWRAAYDKGLPMDQASRMQRAREQGFDVDQRYFRSNLKDHEAYNPTGKFMGHKGLSGISVTDNPEMASRYLERFGDSGWVDGKPNQAFEKNVAPVFIRAPVRAEYDAAIPPPKGFPMGSPLPENYSWPESLNGVDAAVFPDRITQRGDVAHWAPGDEELLKALSDEGVMEGTETILRDPANIRSVNAAFDPENIGKPNLLGMGRVAVDSDLIKLLMAYGAFGGMSAGALATLDAQKHGAKGF